MTPTVPPLEELVAPSHWRTVDFISDLHLQASEPATVAAWQQYLQTTPADAVFLLGDIFEVWVGDDAIHDPGSFEGQVCAQLQAAARRTALYFMHGNRDFLAGGAFLQHCGITGLQQFLSQPLATRRAQARGIRQESEARKQSGTVYADVDHASAIAWLQAAGAQTLIHGHTHRPADHALAPGLQRVVLSDWDAAALPPRLETLRLSATGLERVALGPM